MRALACAWLLLVSCAGTAHAEGSKTWFDEVAPRTCSWDAASGSLRIAATASLPDQYLGEEALTSMSHRAHLGLDVDPLDGAVASCGDTLPQPPQAEQVRTVDATVGSSMTYVWVRPPDPARGGWMPTWNITPVAGAKQPWIVIVVSYDGFAQPQPVNIVGTATGLDLDGNGTQDVTVNAPNFTVEVLAEGTSGLVDLRAVPWHPSRYWHDNGYGRRIRLGGNGPSTVLGPTSGADLDVRLGGGDDTVELTGLERNEVRTEGGNDTIRVRGGSSNEIVAGPGDDTVETTSGSDAVYGDDYRTPIRGIDNGTDHITTGAGDDYVYGGYGADVIDTGLGSDKLTSNAEGGRLDAGPGWDKLNVFGGLRTTTVNCGIGPDEVWHGGIRARMSLRGCEKVDPRPAPDYETGYDPVLRPSTPPGNRSHYDGRHEHFSDTSTWGFERCRWDTSTGTMTRTWAGTGDLNMGAEGSLPYRNMCGETHVDPTLVRKLVVSVATPRAGVLVAPSQIARTGDELKVEFRPPPSSAALSPRVYVSDSGTSQNARRFNIRATRDGLDLNNDGDVDVTVVAEHWNVDLYTRRHYGRFDLREVPTLPHEWANYSLGSRRNVVFGPTSGPDIYLDTRGTAARHALLEGQSDEIVLGSGDDTVYTGGGWDVVDSGAGNDYVNPSIGNDVVHTGPGDDQVYNDVNRSERWARGDDRTWLGPGNDFADSGLGEDITYGEAGDDIILDDGGLAGLVDAGPGNDEVRADSTGRPILVRCGAGNDLQRVNGYAEFPDKVEDPTNARYVGCERNHELPSMYSGWRLSWWLPGGSISSDRSLR